MARMSKSFLGLVFIGALLLGGPFAGSLRAQDAKSAEAGRPSSNGTEVVFEWLYSCTYGKGCSFNCPGSGGATSVTKLSMRLMSIPLAGRNNVAGIFYEYSTMEIPRANGFSITTGISTLSCQVNGMTLDYSGSPKQNGAPAVNGNGSPAVTSSIER
jgi:hypothetical protein